MERRTIGEGPPPSNEQPDEPIPELLDEKILLTKNTIPSIIFRVNKDNLDKITTGIRKFTNFMFEKKFLIDREALVAASKVLYLVCLIKEGMNVFTFM